ncbi:MAG: dehalogenase [Myxococcota bacterium]
MGVFSGIEILFFVLGALTTLGAGALGYLWNRFRLGWRVLGLGAFGLVLTLFALAWSVSSVLEGEAQAANVGVMVFGVPGLLCLGLARRWALGEISRLQPRRPAS